MDDMKDKVKGFMKKVNTPFSSSSSGKFKGQGRVLGGTSSSSSSPIGSTNLIPKTHQTIQTPNPPKPPKPKPIPTPIVAPTPPNPNPNPDSNRKLSNGFDPFDSLVTSSKRSQVVDSVNAFECPVCGHSYPSEDEVSVHIDSCIVENSSVTNPETVVEGDDISVCVGKFFNGNSSERSVEVVLKLLRNIVKEPENVKFRRIRICNPKIRETIVEVVGGVELLERVGFRLQEEDGDEMWLVMEVPLEGQIQLIKETVSLLEPQKMVDLPSVATSKPDTPIEQKMDDLPFVAAREPDAPIEPKKIDRQIRVFFSVSENVAAKINVPDSFYKLSMDEVKKEADLRKKKLAESQLLIPKSFKEKQAKAARKRYKTTIIRIQFPDGVVLQGVFLPWEPTTSLYEFVSSSLKDPSLEFELWHPVVLKRQVVTQFPAKGEKTPTLDEEDLVPSALIKFKPIETDFRVFTGLTNELLQISEPLTNKATACPA